MNSIYRTEISRLNARSLSHDNDSSRQFEPTGKANYETKTVNKKANGKWTDERDGNIHNESVWTRPREMDLSVRSSKFQSTKFSGFMGSVKLITPSEVHSPLCQTVEETNARRNNIKTRTLRTNIRSHKQFLNSQLYIISLEQQQIYNLITVF